MATLTITGLDTETYARLSAQAARHGRSIGAEAGANLRDRLISPGNADRLSSPAIADGLGTRIHRRFRDIDTGHDTEWPPESLRGGNGSPGCSTGHS